MSNTFDDDQDSDTPTRQKVRARFNSMFSDGRSFSGHERNCCYLNTDGSPAGDGRFANISASSGIDFPDDGRALATVDWDQDGDLDVWTSNRNAPRLRFLRNNTPRSAHFLDLRLVGDGSTTNRDAIGARVEVVLEKSASSKPKSLAESKTPAGSNPQPPLIKTLRAGEGFLSQNSKWLHFGLAAKDDIKKVIVHWPGGQKEEFQGLKADNRYLLSQHSGVAKQIPTASRNLKLNSQEPLSTPLGEVPFRLTTPIELPPLPFQTWAGENQLIEARKGQGLLINFWASWCLPCLKELKEIGKADEQIRSSDLDILALSIDGLNGEPLDAKQAAAILDSSDFYFRSGRATRSLIRRLQALNVLKTESSELPLPFSILLDYRGRLVAVYRGPITIDQILGDLENVGGDLLTRFQQTAPLKGHTLDHPVAREALERANADARFKYADALRQSGLLEMAAKQYEMVLEIFPESKKTRNEIAAVLSQLGQLELAKTHLEKALQSHPDSVATYINLGSISMNQRQYARAKKYYDKAIELAPNDPQILYNLGMTQEALDANEAALKDYSSAIAIQPDFPEAYLKRGTLHLKMQHLDAALSDLSEVIRLKPDSALAYKKRGVAYLQTGLNEQGLLDLSKALKLRPKDEELYNNRGMAYAASGQFAFAVTDYNRAIELNPDAPQVYNNLAWLLATCPDPRHRNGAKALVHAKRACELSQWSYFGSLDTLAAAYAEIGRFDDAVKWQKRGLEYAPEQSKSDLQSRLELYKMGKPYRQPAAD